MDSLSFNMRPAGRFYLMVNQILINAGDMIGFQQNMEKLSFEETAFFHLHSSREADICEEPLHTPRKKSFSGKSPISTYLGRYQG